MSNEYTKFPNNKPPENVHLYWCSQDQKWKMWFVREDGDFPMDHIAGGPEDDYIPSRVDAYFKFQFVMEE